jgi:hypothetical protein
MPTDADDVLLTAGLAALRLSRICHRPITPATVRKWASRRRVRARGAAGRANLYSMLELQAYADSIYGT